MISANNNNSREKPDLVSQLAPKFIRATSSYFDFNACLIKIRNLQKNQYMSGDPTLRADTVFNSEEFIPALLDKIDDFLDDIFEAEFCNYSRDGNDGQVANDVGVSSSSSSSSASSHVPPGQRQYVVASICGLFQSVPFFRRCASDHFRAHLDDFMRFADILVSSGFVQKIVDLCESDHDDFTAEHKEVSTLLIKEIFSLVRNLASDLMATPTPVASAANNNRGATAVAVNHTNHNNNNNNFSAREFVATVFAAPAFLGTLVRVVEILPDDVLTQMHSFLRTLFTIEPGRLTNMDFLRSGKNKNENKNNNLGSSLSTTTTTTTTTPTAASSLLQSFFSLPIIVEKLTSVYDLSPAKSAITTSAKQQTSFRHWMFLLRCFAQYATDEAIITSLLVVDDQTSNNSDDNKNSSEDATDRHRFNFYPNMLVAFFSQLSVEVELAHPICRILSLFQKPAMKTQKSSTSHESEDSKSLPIQFLETEMFKLLNSPFPMFSSDYNGDNKNNNNNNARVEFQTAASNHHKNNKSQKNSAGTKISSAQQEQNESQNACATPLQIAAFLCDSLVCELLIGAGANVDGRILITSNNNNSNDDDVKSRSKNNIQETASAFSRTVYGQDQMTPLILAISSPRHRCDVVSVLLDADFRSTGNASGFYFSSDGQDKNSVSLFSLFYDAVADAMLPDAGGCSPYEYANDEPKCAKCLATIEKAIRWQRPL